MNNSQQFSPLLLGITMCRVLLRPSCRARPTRINQLHLSRKTSVSFRGIDYVNRSSTNIFTTDAGARRRQSRNVILPVVNLDPPSTRCVLPTPSSIRSLAADPSETRHSKAARRLSTLRVLRATRRSFALREPPAIETPAACVALDSGHTSCHQTSPRLTTGVYSLYVLVWLTFPRRPSPNMDLFWIVRPIVLIYFSVILS